MTRKPKYQTILDDLMLAMRNGKFADGAKLPSERALATRYGVTRTTARRALIHLTDMRLVQREGPHGTRVKPGRVGDRAVSISLVCPEGMNSVVEEFLRSAIAETNRRQWGHRIIRVETNNEASYSYPLSLGNECLLLGEPTDFRPGSRLEELLRKAAGRCAVLGTRMDYAGIPSCICDDLKAVTLALHRFRDRGHSRIAFLCGPDPLDHPTTSVQIHTWRRCLSGPMSEADLAVGLIRLDPTEPFACMTTAAYKAVRRFLSHPKSKEFTGLLCQTEEFANGASAACRDAGRPIPTGISLIQLGVATRAAMASPVREVIDVDIREHVRSALAMIEKALEGSLDLSQPLCVIPPRLVPGASVQTL